MWKAALPCFLMVLRVGSLKFGAWELIFGACGVIFRALGLGVGGLGAIFGASGLILGAVGLNVGASGLIFRASGLIFCDFVWKTMFFTKPYVFQRFLMILRVRGVTF